MQMFDRLNANQQPYIQSGYGAMSRLNTLLGLGGGSGAGGAGAPGGARMPSPAYTPTPSGGIDQRIPSPVAQGPTAQDYSGQSTRLRQILTLRAQNGDTEAARMLGGI